MLVDASAVSDAEITISNSAVHVESLRRRLVEDGAPHTAVNFQPRIDDSGTFRLVATLVFKLSESACVAGLAAPKVNDTLVVITSELLGAGVTVGRNVGAGIGADVGTCVGRVVGASVGTAVGPLVGDDDGMSDGGSVGMGVGEIVGNDDGTSVGSEDGAGVGKNVGTNEGTSVGSGDGAGDGASVGSEEGTDDGAQSVDAAQPSQVQQPANIFVTVISDAIFQQSS